MLTPANVKMVGGRLPLGGHGYRDTAPFRVQKLLLVLVPELTEPTPYRLDGDEGGGCDTDF
jgi:hypothetical protein